MAKDHVVLLDLPASMFGMRVRLALAEKKVEFDYREQDVFDKSPELLQANPIHKKVPVLIHDGRPLCESLLILEYIDEVWKDHPLLPSEPYSRARARFWANFIDNKLYSAGRNLWATKGEDWEKGRVETIGSLKLLEEELGDKEYLGGEEFGYLDIALLGFAPWFKVYERYGNFILENECPKLVEWVKRCSGRPSASKWLTAEDKVIEFAGVLNKKYGPK